MASRMLQMRMASRQILCDCRASRILQVGRTWNYINRAREQGLPTDVGKAADDVAKGVKAADDV